MVGAPSADIWYALPYYHMRWPNIHLGYLLDRASCYSHTFLLYPSLCHCICHFTGILIFRLVFKENWNDNTMVNALFVDGRWFGYPFMCILLGFKDDGVVKRTKNMLLLLWYCIFVYLMHATFEKILLLCFLHVENLVKVLITRETVEFLALVKHIGLIC